jgi:hypothetical protein
MRAIIGRALLVAGTLALGGCVVWAVKLIPAYQKMVRTGDGAGFGLGLTGLLFIFLPVAGTLLLGGVLLSPPAKLPALRIGRVGQQATVLLSFAGAAGVFLSLVCFIAVNLVHTARYYPGQDLLTVLLQNLAFSLPLLALATLLTLAGLALCGRRPI